MSRVTGGWEPMKIPEPRRRQDMPLNSGRYVYSGSDVTINIGDRAFVAVGVVGTIHVDASPESGRVFIDRLDLDWTEITRG